MALPHLARLLGTPLTLGSSILDEPRRQSSAAFTLPGYAVRRIAAARRILRHWPFGDTCLRQALVSGHLLRRLRPTLQIGVSKVEDQVRAHAWIVVEGTALVTCDDNQFLLQANQSTFIPLGARHRLENPGKTPLRLIEVQSGSYLGEDDIVRFEDTYGRAPAQKKPV